MIFKCLGVLLLCVFVGLAFTEVIYRAILFPVRDYLDSAIVERHFGDTGGETGTSDSETPESLASQLAALVRELENPDLADSERIALQGQCIRVLSRELTGSFSDTPEDSGKGRVRIIYTSPVEPFTVKLRVAFLGGIAFGVPFICYFIWSFIGPGLKKKEQRLARKSIFLATLLFLLGGAFGYSFLPFGIPALMKFSASGVEQIWPLQAYIAFCTRLILAFGLVFEMPLVLGLLTRLGVVSPATLAKGRPYAVIIFFVLAAILTPPDIYSQIALAIPMIGLYELSIWVGKRGMPNSQ